MANNAAAKTGGEIGKTAGHQVSIEVDILPSGRFSAQNIEQHAKHRDHHDRNDFNKSPEARQRIDLVDKRRIDTAGEPMTRERTQQPPILPSIVRCVAEQSPLFLPMLQTVLALSIRQIDGK